MGFAAANIQAMFHIYVVKILGCSLLQAYPLLQSLSHLGTILLVIPWVKIHLCSKHQQSVVTREGVPTSGTGHPL